MPNLIKTSAVTRVVVVSALSVVALAFFVLRWTPAGAEAPPAHRPGMNLAMGVPAEEAMEGRDCASGISIRIEFGHLCTEVCSVDNECLAGWGCKVIEQGNGEPIGLCVPRRINVETPSP